MTGNIGGPLIYLAETTSTMDEVDQRAALGAAEGLAVWTDYQTKGRGRADRNWHSEPGAGLAFSVLLRPGLLPAAISPLPLILGVAVARALIEIAGVDVRLKWPNDLLVGDRKLGGILVKSRSIAGRLAFVNAGIGLNVTAHPAHLEETATSLTTAGGRPIDRRQLLVAILASIDLHYRAFVDSRGRFNRSEYESLLAFQGEQVEMQIDGIRHCGEQLGVDESGALKLLLADGQVATFTIGDLARGPRRAGDASQS